MKMIMSMQNIFHFTLIEYAKYLQPQCLFDPDIFLMISYLLVLVYMHITPSAQLLNIT